MVRTDIEYNILCVLVTLGIGIECSHCLIVLYKLLYDTLIFVSQFMSLIFSAHWHLTNGPIFSPLSVSFMVLLKPAWPLYLYNSLISVPFRHPCMDYVRELIWKTFYQHFWSLHYGIVHLEQDGISSWFSCFWKLLWRFYFYQNMFLPCRLYKDTTTHRYVGQPWHAG